MKQVGDKLYIITHAYWHVIGEIEAIITPRMVSLKNVVMIYSSNKSWQEFFAKGISKGDKYWHVPDMPDCSIIDSFKWDHDIPEAP